MIRINLLGRTRPKATRTAVDELQTCVRHRTHRDSSEFYGHYMPVFNASQQVLAHIQKQTGEKARLEQLKQEVQLRNKKRCFSNVFP